MRGIAILLFTFFFTTIQSCQKASVTFVDIVENTPWGEEVFKEPVFPASQFPITDFGATPESANNQTAIQAAIDACSQKGGGTVVVPRGKWKTSWLELRSNVNLFLTEGAILLFSDDIALYSTPTFTRWEGIECMNYHPLIYAKDVENIAITGSGKIDGNGKKWWTFKGKQIETLTKLYDQVQEDVPVAQRNCLAYAPTSYLRPSLIQTINCKNVLVEGIEVGSGPMWTIHFVYCENVIARNLKVITNGVNNDGITPDACNKVLIDNCYFSTGDDCIVIKSGLNEDGWRVNKPSQNIIIKNCITNKGHGGVVIGSEMSGGVRNVYVHDCDFSHTQRGLRFKSMKGRGGIVENLWFENIKMDSIEAEAIQINMHYGSSSIAPRTQTPPVFRNFHFKNITSSYAETAIRLNGIDDHYIDSMTFSGLTMKCKYGIVIKNAENSSFDSLNIQAGVGPISITNARNIWFRNLRYEAAIDTMVRLYGHIEGVYFRHTNIREYKFPYQSEASMHTRVIEID